MLVFTLVKSSDSFSASSSIPVTFSWVRTPTSSKRPTLSTPLSCLSWKRKCNSYCNQASLLKFRVISDVTEELLTVIGVFTHFFGLETTLEERQFFKKLAVLVGTRSARLSACGIAAIVSKKGYLEEGCAVGADGSLYNVCVNVVTVFYILDRANRRIKKYPNFADRVHEALTDIFGESGKKIVTHHAEDGSGVGSAIIAGASLQYSRVKAKLISHLLFF